MLPALTSDLRSHRYQHTVRVCALQEDLRSLPYGDLTEVSRAGAQPLGSPTGQGHRAEAGQPQLPPHPMPRRTEVPGNARKSGPPISNSPPGSVLGGGHSGGGTNSACVGFRVVTPGTTSNLLVTSGKVSGQSCRLTSRAGSVLCRWGSKCWTVAELPRAPLPHSLLGPGAQGSPPNTAPGCQSDPQPLLRPGRLSPLPEPSALPPSPT